MISLEGVTASYGNSTPLDDVDLTIETGASVAVMGPSGSGKSTLLRLISGTQQPTAGRIKIDGKDVVAASWSSSADDRVCLIHQDYRLLSFLTVIDNLKFAAEVRARVVDDSDLASALRHAGLPESLLNRFPDTLSGGEQQRVAIARALLLRTPVLLADEPTGALDRRNTQTVVDSLSSLAASQDLTVIVATHDEAVASQLDSGLVIDEGKVKWVR